MRRLWLRAEARVDALIVLVTVGAVIELALRRGSPESPRVPMWFNVLAILIMELPLFARRRFPFAAPAVYWLAVVAVNADLSATSVDEQVPARPRW